MPLGQGLILASDTSTNAGVDQVAVFHNMSVFDMPGERAITHESDIMEAVKCEVRTDLV